MIKKAMAAYIRSAGLDCVSVVDYAEEQMSGGYCETCYYDEQVIVITYLDTDSNERRFVWWDDMGTVIATLDRFSESLT